jgi:hypothetical protein
MVNRNFYIKISETFSAQNMRLKAQLKLRKNKIHVILKYLEYY